MQHDGNRITCISACEFTVKSLFITGQNMVYSLQHLNSLTSRLNLQISSWKAVATRTLQWRKQRWQYWHQCQEKACQCTAWPPDVELSATHIYRQNIRDILCTAVTQTHQHQYKVLLRQFTQQWCLSWQLLPLELIGQELCLGHSFDCQQLQQDRLRLLHCHCLSPLCPLCLQIILDLYTAI